LFVQYTARSNARLTGAVLSGKTTEPVKAVAMKVHREEHNSGSQIFMFYVAVKKALEFCENRYSNLLKIMQQK
jgi:hypothetical protein